VRTISALLLLTLTGCSTLLATLPPSELPNVNGHHHLQREGRVYYTQHQVQTVDGKATTLTCNDTWIAEVVCTDGSRYDFCYPIVARYERGLLTVEGGNREPKQFLEGEVRFVELHAKECQCTGGGVIYWVTTNPGDATIKEWGHAPSAAGWYFLFNRRRNFYIPVRISKPGYKTIETRLTFDRVYDTREEAEANVKRFHFDLEVKNR